MATRYIFSVFLLICAARLYPQSPELEQSVYGPGPFLSIDRSQWSLFRNMAGLANSDSWQAVFGYRRPYNLSDLQSLSWGIILPLKPVLGVSMFQTGGNAYRSIQFALNTALRFQNLWLGLRARYWRFSFAGLKQFNRASLDIGLQLQLTDKLVVGTFLSNITGSNIGPSQQLPIIWATGVHYEPSDKLIFFLEAGHQLMYILEIKVGGEYNIDERLAARTGFNTATKQSYFGLLLKTGNVEVDYAITIHLSLGMIHQAGISYSW